MANSNIIKTLFKTLCGSFVTCHCV